MCFSYLVTNMFFFSFDLQNSKTLLIYLQGAMRMFRLYSRPQFMFQPPTQRGSGLPLPAVRVDQPLPGAMMGLEPVLPDNMWSSPYPNNSFAFGAPAEGTEVVQPGAPVTSEW